MIARRSLHVIAGVTLVLMVICGKRYTLTDESEQVQTARQTDIYIGNVGISLRNQLAHASLSNLSDAETFRSGAGAGYMSRMWCQINCTTGVPCEYKDELDFRIIVITYKRSESLKKCLRRVAELNTLGDRVGVDIWVDRSKQGEIDPKTLEIALSFQKTWTKGRACVHLQQKNAFIIGQWIDTWRPREGTREMALILEDDIDLSPLAYKWLKHVNEHFHNWPDIAGYTLQMENVKFIKHMKHASGPKTEQIFLHFPPNTWGFAPHPKHWRNFQNWFHEMRKNRTFQPYIPGTVPNSWFKNFVKKGTADAMWEMWEMYYFINNNLYTVCSNLVKYTGRKDVLLDTNRQEKGLHHGAGEKHDNSVNLMTTWSDDYIKFPDKVTRYDLDGMVVHV